MLISKTVLFILICVTSINCYLSVKQDDDLSLTNQLIQIYDKYYDYSYKQSLVLIIIQSLEMDNVGINFTKYVYNNSKTSIVTLNLKGGCKMDTSLEVLSYLKYINYKKM